MRKLRTILATAAATAVALAIPVSPAQAEPSIDVSYSTSCGRVTVVSSSAVKVQVYYGPSTLATSLADADGTAILGPNLLDFDTIATVRSSLYVTAIPYGSSPSTWTIKRLAVPQDCTGVHSSVTLAGTRRVGHTLTVKLLKWVPKPLFTSYTWYRSGKQISGASSSSYKLTAADKGKHIKVKVQASFVGYKDATRTSKSTGAIKAGLLTSARPKVTITGWLATAWAGNWGPSPLTLSYQWYKGSKKISGATSGLFSVPTSYVGKSIRVKVIGQKPGYGTVARYSKPVTVTGSE